MTPDLRDRIERLHEGYAVVERALCKVSGDARTGVPDMETIFGQLNDAATIADRLRREMEKIALALYAASGGFDL